ncbi:MAG: hypothetical protein R3B06_15500 [Kofleriaceae bacterium]
MTTPPAHPLEPDFAAEVARLEARLPTARFDAVPRLRQAREQWARARLGLPPAGELVGLVRAAVEEDAAPAHASEAAQHLAAAEAWQWEIGTWASGSGEGLASMYAVRTLQLAQAWLLAGVAPARAGALLDQVEGDANQIVAPLAAHVAALRARLGAATG